MQINSNRALWRTYLFVLSFTCIVVGVFLYLKWIEIQQTAVLQQTYSNKIISKSINNYLDKQASLLELMGERVRRQLELKRYEKIQSELDMLISSSNELAGLVILDAQGRPLTVSSSFASPFQNESLDSLIKLDNNSGLSSLDNDGNLLIGRTFFSTELEKWVIPLLFSIRNEHGELIADIILILNLSGLDQNWLGQSQPNFQKYLLLREDLYRQYGTFFKSDKYTQRYPEAFSAERFYYLAELMTLQTGFSLEDLKAGELVLTFSGFDADDTPYLLTVNFNTKYRLFSVLGVPFSDLYLKMIPAISWMLIFLLVFNAGLFWLFRRNILTELNAKDALHYQVEHDPLTQLPNRRYLVNHLKDWSVEQNGVFSLLYIDLKNFKHCNDVHGHSMGDKILCIVSKRLVHFFDKCLCVRQGGDEFIVLSPVTNDDAIRLRCLEFLKELEKTIQIEHLSFSIHASIGVAIAPHDGSSLDELLRKADMAMYEAKRRQQNVGLYSAELERRTKQASDIEHELSHALQNNEFSVVYQPQVDAYSYQVLGIEALIRWNNPKLGFVPPDLFIPVAEANGMIYEIGRFVMQAALCDAKEICRQSGFLHKLRVSVNVSVSQLFNDDFVEDMQSLLNEYTDQPITFMLEVTESLFIDDLLRAKEILLRAKECGIYISLDDFGTGYSSLSVLSKLPINELKIDRSFVNDILTDEHDWLLAKSIINLCKSLSIPVVAEGVETKAQADRLAAHGCDIFQGYYFSKPLPKAELIDFLKEKGGGRRDLI